jgi:Ca2+-binding RTX toxin-like protein
MIIRQVGGTDSSPVSSNIVLSNGGQLYVGDRLTDTLLDDAGNDATALSTQLQSVQVWGLGGADTISTGDGNDRVYGNTGADSVSGGAGNDSIYGGQENDTVSGGGGNDQVAGDLGNDQVNGGSGNDVLYGGAGNDVIDPDTGNDTIFAGNGNDTVTIGDSDTGNKLVYMDKLQDEVNIISTTGDHVVYLGDNNDYANLEANSGDIQIFGQDGNDVLRAQNSGSDTLDGGNDDDDVLIENGSVGNKVLIGGFGDDFIRVEDFSGSAGAQILPNTRATVSGGEGDDYIEYGRGLFITDANDGGTDDDYLVVYGQTILTLRDKSIENIESVDFFADGDSVVFADGNVAPGATLVVRDGKSSDLFDGSRETDGRFVMDGGRRRGHADRRRRCRHADRQLVRRPPRRRRR